MYVPGVFFFFVCDDVEQAMNNQELLRASVQFSNN